MELTFINQHNLNDCVQWDVNLVRAHAVGAALWWSVVTVAELFWVNVVVLRDERSRW